MNILYRVPLRNMLLGGLSSLLLAACSGGIPEKGKLIDSIHPRSDFATATTMQSLLRPENLHASGVINDPAAAAYPKSIVDNLLSHWNGPKPTVQIFLSPRQEFTSDVSAGGAIFLNAGLIQYFHDTPAVQSEDALAFVLAHELSHILLGHTEHQLENQRIKDYTSSFIKWGSIAGGAIAHAGTSGAQAAIASMGLKTFSDTTLFPSWTRQQEDEADALAVDLMARTGYSVDQALSVLNALKAEEPRDAEIAAQTARNADTKFHTDAFTLSAKKGDDLDAAFVSYLNDLKKTHHEASARVAMTSRYITREYDDQDAVALRRAPLMQWVGSRDVSALLTQSAALQQAASNVSDKNWTEARRILRGIRPPGNASQYWALLMFQTDSATGQQRDAARILEAASSRDDVTFPIADAWGESLSKAGKWNDAETYLVTQESAFGDRSFLPGRIANATRSKDEILKTKLVGICLASGDEDLQAQCSAAGK